ncbi:MAG: glycosyltransferase family 2 protein, partial [Pseudomonadota bacterium]
QLVRHGGVFPVQVLRLFRNGAGRCEERWMDEHIIVDGPVRPLRGAIIDDNRNPLDWWVAKHNAYASKEVVDMLYRSGRADHPAGRAGIKRWVKMHLYRRLPGGMRAGLYFFYRYVLRLGFLDGPQARQFHVLQGFWYRYLVDAKLTEVHRFMQTECVDEATAIAAVLGVDVGQTGKVKAA